MSDSNAPQPDNNADRDQQLEAIVADYIRASETGSAPNRNVILKRHPELEDELRQFFGQHDRMNQIAAPIRGFGDSLAQAVGPGQQLSYVGNYELLEEIARGGMGVVYKARQTTLGRVVAVKMIVSGRMASELDVQRFQVEAQAAAGLQHPNIVSIHEVGQHEGWHYFSMDYVEGRDLSKILRENLLSAKQAATYVRQMAEAIHYAHQRGILHRDLKPSNILIDSHDQVHITDFGLAMRVEGGSDLTRTGQIVGTPSYMPPEQAQCSRALIGPGSDVYSLGAVLYECLTGRAPFRADSVMKTLEQVIHAEAASPRTLNAAIPRDLETICLKCLEKEPHRRYGTAQLLADDIGRFLKGESIAARPVSRPTRAWRWCLRNPAVAGLLVTVAMCLVGGTVVSSYFAMMEARQFNKLMAEQEQSKSLRLSVADQVQRSLQLNELIADGEEKLRGGETKLQAGEEKLFDTYMQLARGAWRADKVELADQYLNDCPTSLRNTEWNELKRKCSPEVLSLDIRHCEAFSSDGIMAAAVSDYAIHLWNVVEKRRTHVVATESSLFGPVALNFDGSLLAYYQFANGPGREIIVWDVQSHSILCKLDGHQFPITGITFSPDQVHLATASFRARSRNISEEGEVFVWDLRTFQKTVSLQGRKHAVFSHDGRWLAAEGSGKRLATDSSNDGKILVWKLADAGKTPLAIGDSSRGLVTSHPCFHPTKSEIAVSDCIAPGVEFWDVANGQMIRRLTSEISPSKMSYSPDGKHFAIFGSRPTEADRPAFFRGVTWNTVTRERERTLPWNTEPISLLAFSQDCHKLLTADSNTIKILDIRLPSDPTEVILNDVRDLKVGRFDWPQWGGSRSRINTPAGKNIPTGWDIRSSKNIKWTVPLGSETYGNPVVANGKIFVGTNNAAGYLKQYPSTIDLGVLLCFEETTGNFLWQHSNEKLPTGRVNDWPNQGVCSTPVVDGDRLWYVSNRGEVVCLDTQGFYDDEDDGYQDGVWSSLFNVPVYAHFLPNLGYLSQFWTKVFRDHNLEISRNVSIAEVNREWIVGEWRKEGGESTLVDRFGSRTVGGKSSLVNRFCIRRDGTLLRVFDVPEKGESEKELFTVEDLILPALGTNEVAKDLREHFSKLNIQLPEQVDIHTVQPGKLWSFSIGSAGQRTDFRMRLWRDSLLYVEKRIKPAEKGEADVVWKFDMMTELGVHQHNMATCSMLSVDGVLFVCTSNGVDDSHKGLPAPEAPSFVAIDRETGKVVWTDNSPGENILHAQWASPSYGVFNGQPQVIFPGGDGWLYSFDPKGDGHGGSKLLWKFDANPKTSLYKLNGSTRNHFIAFPAIYDGLVYIAVGEDPEHGEGYGHLWCIDPTKRLDGGDVSPELAIDQAGNVLAARRLQAVDVTMGERAIPNPNSAVVWHYSSYDQDNDGKIEFEETFHRSLSTPVIKDDVLYIADFSGLFHCLNAKTGKVYWTYDLNAACWSTALLVDGKVYIADEDGDVAIFRHSADPRFAMKSVRESNHSGFKKGDKVWDGEMINQCNLGSAIFTTPIVANNVLYIANRNRLFAIEVSSETDRQAAQSLHEPFKAHNTNEP